MLVPWSVGVLYIYIFLLQKALESIFCMYVLKIVGKERKAGPILHATLP